MATKSNRNIVRWREDFTKSMQDFRGDDAPNLWSDVFIPQGHLKALHPQSILIEGMRGSGKSFWSHVFTQPGFRQQLIQSDANGWLKTGLSLVTDCKGILWSKHNPQLPNKASVKGWLDEPDFDSMLFWAVVILRQFPIDSELGMPGGDKFDEWSEPIRWAQKNPERVMRALHLLDEEQTLKSELILVVIDGLDVVSSKFSQSQNLMRGLLQVLLEFRYAKGLRFKVFVREDMLTSAAATVSDASKLINEKASLEWSPQDLFGLTFHHLAQRSSYFRTRFENINGQKFKLSAKTGKYEHPTLLESEAQEKMWEWLAGPYMGASPMKGRTYSWIMRHLADGKNRISPRTFLTAVKGSLEETCKRFPLHPLVIHHDAIRDGVRAASVVRRNELDEDYQWVKIVLDILTEKNIKVPLDWSDLLAEWKSGKKESLDAVNLVEAKAKNSLIPWEIGAAQTWDEKALHLLDTLNNIGVLQIRERQSVLRVDLPDIYRLAYKIGRNGGIPVQKKK